MFKFVVSNKQNILTLFKLLSLGVITFIVLGSISIHNQDPNMAQFISTGIGAGKLALVLYCITLLPGIAKRFNIRNNFFGVIMLFRRQFGILMYLCAIAHYFIVTLVPIITFNVIPPYSLFTIMGFYGFLCLLPLFITSNDFSVRKLGKNWYRLHKLTYIAMFLILLHVGLHRISVWTALLFTVVLFEVLSYIYYFYQKSKTPVVQSQ